MICEAALSGGCSRTRRFRNALRHSSKCSSLLVLLILTPTAAFVPISSLSQNAATRPSLLQREALIPLPVDELEQLINVGVPSGSQYAVYWGKTASEKYARFLESCLVSFLGMCFSYFLSFIIGGFVATILGSLFLFWGILSPELKAYQRNWEFLGGRPLVDPWTVRGDPEKAGLYGALYLGRVMDVCVVEDSNDDEEYDLIEFQDYTMESDELERFTGNPYLLRVLATDKTGRELQVHARMSEDYLEIEKGMPLTGILLSTSPRMDRLNGITDLYVPDAGRDGCWIGDYPFLDQTEMQVLLTEDDEIWGSLEEERVDASALVNPLFDGGNDDEGAKTCTDDDDKVRISRRRESRR